MLLYVTSNSGKFNYAVRQLDPLGIRLEQKILDLVEIQSKSVEAIARQKADAAYAMLETPLLVNDACWNIPALNGFPGPYMAYVDGWFSTADFLRLMRDVDDRRVFLTEVVVYADQHHRKVFMDTLAGTILQAAAGDSARRAFDPIVSFRSDSKSLTQARAEQLPTLEIDFAMWREFATWYASPDFRAEE